MDVLAFMRPYISRLVMFSIGVALNVALLYLIRRRTPANLRSYSIVMAIHAVNDLLNEFFNFFGAVIYINAGMHFSRPSPARRHSLSDSLLVLDDRAYYWSNAIFARFYSAATVKFMILG